MSEVQSNITYVHYHVALAAALQVLQWLWQEQQLSLMVR